MTLTSYLARRLCWTAIGITGAFLLGGALAGFGAGFICLEFQGSVLGGEYPSTRALCNQVLTFGFICALTAVAVCVALVLLRTWPRQVPSAPGPLHPGDSRPITLGVLLVILPPGTAVAVRPAFDFVRQNFDRMSTSVDGLLLMAPMLDVTAAATLLVGGVAVLLLFVAGDHLFPRGLIVLALIHLGLLMCCITAAEITRAATTFAAEAIPILQQHDDVVQASARNLAWLVPVYAMAIPLLLVAAKDRATVTPSDAGGAARPAQPLRRLANRSERRQDLFQSPYYSLRARYLMWPFGGLIYIDDLDTARSFRAQVVPLQLKKTIVVYSSGSNATPILTLEARQILPIGARYNIVDSGTKERIAAVGDRMGGTWSIHDDRDQHVGDMTRRALSLGSATFAVDLGSESSVTLRWSSTPRPTVALDCSRDPDQLVDRRVAISLALLLFIKESSGS